MRRAATPELSRGAVRPTVNADRVSIGKVRKYVSFFLLERDGFIVPVYGSRRCVRQVDTCSGRMASTSGNAATNRLSLSAALPGQK